MKFRKILVLAILSSMLFLSGAVVSFAADDDDSVVETNVDEAQGMRTTILPDPGEDNTVEKCSEFLMENSSTKLRVKLEDDEDVNKILGCAIKTGDVRLFMVPYFIKYILEFLIGISGLLSVMAIIIGGFAYLFAGVADDKEKGKNAIKNGIIGMVLVFSAWAIVNIVISFLTG